MNIGEVKRVDKRGATALLYSHDDGFTRHVVEIYPNGSHLCRINESPCFRRGTHDHMARAHGFDLTDMPSDLRHWLQP